MVDWKKLLYVRWQDALFFVIVMFLLVSYWHDTNQVKDIVANPCNYCPAYVSGYVVENPGLNLVINYSEDFKRNENPG
jgi:hypothetical protein